MGLFLLSPFRLSSGEAGTRRRARPPRPFAGTLERLGGGDGAGRRPSYRPTLDRLEDRTVPSLISSQVLALTRTTVTVTPPAVPFNPTADQTITLTATVVGVLGPTNGGTVTFTVGGLGTVNDVPVVNGVAQTSFTVPAGTPPNTYTVTATYSGTGTTNGSTGSTTFAVTAPVPTFCQSPEAEAFLGTAARFAVLAGSTVTNTGPTTIIGDVGVSPGTAITGFPPGSVTVGKPGSGGTIHSADAIASQARNDVIIAYNVLAGEPPTQNLTGQDLGGLTLTPGVYHFDDSAQLTGTLTLDAQGDPNGRFVFQIGSTLTTGSGSVVQVINGGLGENVFWQVGSSATLGSTTRFEGNILALTSITLNTRASIACGRALAINGAVTLDTNFIDPPLHAPSGFPPTATLAAPAAGVRGQSLAFVVGAESPLPADHADEFGYTVRWGDGSPAQVISPGPATASGLTLTHSYASAGVYTVRVTATDHHGTKSLPVMQSVRIGAVALGEDPADATKTALFVGGSTGNDAITVRPSDAAGGVTVSVNGANRGTFHPTGHVIVYGQAGNDAIRGISRVVEGQAVFVGVPAVFHGGPGNDRLDVRGSTADNVLSGDRGRDVLLGGGGRDLLIGGRGADALDGAGGDDILVGGVSGLTANPQALGAVVAEWGRTDADYLTRTEHLSGSLPGGLNGSTALTPQSVSEDGAIDQLTGSAGLDWFFGVGGSFPDRANDWSGGEIQTLV